MKKFYSLIISIFLIINTMYVWKNEKTKSNLLKENKMQQITIQTMKNINQKQTTMIKKYEDMKVKNKIENENFIQYKNKIEENLKNAKQLNQKQEILNQLFNDVNIF